jgi:hypothetical protein
MIAAGRVAGSVQLGPVLLGISRSIRSVIIQRLSPSKPSAEEIAVNLPTPNTTRQQNVVLRQQAPASVKPRLSASCLS